MSELEFNALISALTDQRNEALNAVAKLRSLLALRDARIAELERAAQKTIDPPLEDHMKDADGPHH